MNKTVNQSLSTARVIVALTISLLGAIVIWVAVPYNNFRLDNTYLADSFLPEAVVGLLLFLVLAINPLLRFAGPRWALNRRQIALIASLLLFAAVIPSNGLMRMFPRLVAETNQGFHTSVTTSQIAADADLPPVLFPDPLPQRAEDGSVLTKPTPLSDKFIDELYPDESVPWSAWVAPMASWGMLIIAMWAMMVGLGCVVYPQWRDRERLAFPLLNVYHAFIEDDFDGRSDRLLPAVFTTPGFLIACSVVFGIHAFRGLHIFTNAFPTVPVDWQLTEYFSDSILRHSPLSFKRQAIFFSVLGVAYFIPSRYAISIWGWVVGYSIYVTLGRAYVPAFNDGQVNDQAFGMLLAIAIWVLWLGRAHWRQVGRAMFGRAGGGPESRRDAIAGWMFAIGCAGIALWLNWAGCSLWWSILAAIGCAVVTLLMARIIAETGVPVLWMSRVSVGGFTSMFPLAWLSPNILLFSSVFYAILTRTTAVNAGVISTLALGMDRESKPSYQSRLMIGGLAVLVIGFMVCGAVHLNMGYRSDEVSTAAKMSATKINEWVRADQEEYEFFNSQRGHQAVGLGVGSALLWACSRFPSWPIHPVGILFCQHSIGNLLWFSIFLGWLVKVSITSLFGGRAYRQARPVFLGLILGELAAVIVWTLVPVIIIMATGADPSDVPRYTLFKYP